MSVRSLGYDTENLDKIFCYFMRTILHLQKTGIENLPLKNNLPMPFQTFLDTAMRIFLSAGSPELARLILEAEYSVFIAKNEEISVEITVGLQVIKELTWHIYYDRDYYGYLLSLENIWGNDAIAYAVRTFYPNLPEDIKDKYHINELIQEVPLNMFQSDDF